MTSKDALDTAFRYSDIALKILQYMMAVSIGLGGWLLGSGDLSGSDYFSGLRLGWALLYLIVAVMALGTYHLTLHRVAAAFELARELAQDDLAQRSAFATITGPPFRKISTYCLVAMVLAVEGAILFYGTPLFPG